MNPYLFRFKKTAAQVAHNNAFSMGTFIRNYGLSDFYTDGILEGDGPADIDAKALMYFCVDEDGSFNGFEVGVMVAVQFLREALTGPYSGRQMQQCFADLWTILNNRPTEDAIRQWISAHFQA
jgi:hypothetical protein